MVLYVRMLMLRGQAILEVNLQYEPGSSSTHRACSGYVGSSLGARSTSAGCRGLSGPVYSGVWFHVSGGGSECAALIIWQ